MSSPFLAAFTEAIVERLVDEGLLELDGERHEVVGFVVGRLASATEHSSLVSSLAGALLACPVVAELYADDHTLKAAITELPRDLLHRGAR